MLARGGLGGEGGIGHTIPPSRLPRGSGVKNIIRASGYQPGVLQRKCKDKAKFAGLAPPSSFFLLLRLPKERSSQRKGNPQRFEFPPRPHRPAGTGGALASRRCEQPTA